MLTCPAYHQTYLTRSYTQEVMMAAGANTAEFSVDTQTDPNS